MLGQLVSMLIPEVVGMDQIAQEISLGIGTVNRKLKEIKDQRAP